MTAIKLAPIAMPRPRMSGHYRVKVIKKDKGVVLDTEFTNDFSGIFINHGFGAGTGSSLQTINARLIDVSSTLTLTTSRQPLSSAERSSAVCLFSITTSSPQNNTINFGTEAEALAAYTQHSTDPSLDYVEYSETAIVSFIADNGKTFDRIALLHYTLVESIYGPNGSASFPYVLSLATIKDDQGNPLTIEKDEDTQIIFTYTIRQYRGADVVQPFTFNGNNYNLLFSTLRRTDPTKNWLTDPTSIQGRGVAGNSIPDTFGRSVHRVVPDALLFWSADAANYFTHGNAVRSFSLLRYADTDIIDGSVIENNKISLGSDPDVSRVIKGVHGFPYAISNSAWFNAQYLGYTQGINTVWITDSASTTHHEECLVYILDEDGFPTGLTLPKDFGMSIELKFQRIQGEPVAGWPNPLPIASSNLNGMVLSPNGETNSVTTQYRFGSDGIFRTRIQRIIDGQVISDDTTTRGFMLPQGASPSAYEVRVIQTSGPTVDQNQVSNWTTLGSSDLLVTHTVERLTIGNTEELLQFTLEVREIANPSNAVSANGQMQLIADNT